eukprot:gnl/TRDRNA2_/TRDRNA2_34061_c0_seq1.p1 gnl/TRDRNA2_/TRDRNA2_34061_c0~~gnl/TRDRNA2_/TRDRNA2_34061_c0_seq1.p1  ORF type:complete len:326 (-),score=65.89 gnl/TRDRNA2_/TRDRNA2_34061_c0_seq1:746-1723(-)
MLDQSSVAAKQVYENQLIINRLGRSSYSDEAFTLFAAKSFSGWEQYTHELDHPETRTRRTGPVDCFRWPNRMPKEQLQEMLHFVDVPSRVEYNMSMNDACESRSEGIREDCKRYAEKQRMRLGVEMVLHPGQAYQCALLDQLPHLHSVIQRAMWQRDLNARVAWREQREINFCCEHYPEMSKQFALKVLVASRLPSYATFANAKAMAAYDAAADEHAEARFGEEKMAKKETDETAAAKAASEDEDALKKRKMTYKRQCKQCKQRAPAQRSDATHAQCLFKSFRGCVRAPLQRETARAASQPETVEAAPEPETVETAPEMVEAAPD